MKIFSASIVSLLMIFQTVAFAATGTFSASGEYLMSDYDTPEIAEEIALDFAKQNAAEQAGIYLESYSRTVDFQLEQDEIKTVASSKVEVLTKNITRQPQSNGRVLLHADITASVDTSELDNFLAQAHEQRQAAIQRYKVIQDMNANIKRDIDALQVKLAAIKDDVADEDLLVEQERINREFLSMQKLEAFGNKLGASKEFKYDMSIIDDAIKINPKNISAYVTHALYVEPILLPDINDINKAIIIKPNEAVLYVLRGGYYSIAGNFKKLDSDDDAEKFFERALENYNKAIELDPTNAYVYVNRATCYETLGQNDKALADYNKAVELAPENKYVYEKRSEFYAEHNDFSAALKDRETAANFGKENMDGFDYIDLGDSYNENKNYLQAIENYTKAIELSPKFAFADHRLPAYNARASVYFAQNEYDKALADCDAGIKLAKNSSDNRADFWINEFEKLKRNIVSIKKLSNAPAPKDEDALLKRAWEYFTMDKYDDALNDLNALIELNPKAGMYVLRAKIYEKLGDNENALADYDKAIELKPDYSSAYENRQLLLNKMHPDRKPVDIFDLMSQADDFNENGNYERAINVYTEILEAEPNYQDAWFRRGNTYFNLRQYERAIADYDKAVELKPNDASAYNNRGVAYENLKQYERAIADYTKAVELNPKDKLYLKNRGDGYRALKNYSHAIEDYTQVLNLDPKNQKAYFYRAWCYDDLGDYSKALDDLNKVLKLNPNYADAYNNRGVVYQKLGDLKKSLADFDKALELDPNRETTKKNRQRVLDAMKK